MDYLELSIKDAMESKKITTAIYAMVTTDNPDSISVNVKGDAESVLASLYHTTCMVAKDMGIEVKDILKTFAKLEVE
jgi:hypothetical protein